MPVSILGVTIDTVTRQQALDIIRSFLDSPKQHQVATINAEFIMAAQKDGELKAILNNSSLKLADGSGILWAATYNALPKRGAWWSVWQMIYSGASLVLWPRYCTSVLPERITGSGLVPDICKLADIEHKTVFLLGGMNGSAQKAAKVLKQRYSRLRIVGVEEDVHVAINKQHELVVNDVEQERVQKKIQHAQPDILLVAFGGNQKQEKWIAKYLPELPSISVAIGVGGAFDFVSGNIRRAPQVFRKLGIEWLWRLLRQPWRLPRIVTATVKYIINVMSNK